jgi:lipopolysaccharide heptosyltransferase II
MPFYHLKNLLLKGLFFLLSPFLNKKSHEIKRICIFSTTGLGDTLWATPAIKALKEFDPAIELTVVTSPVGKEVLLYNPHIHEMIVESLFSFLNLYRVLKKKRFDAILIFHASQRYIFPLAKLLNTGKVIGTLGQSKGLDFLLSQAIRPHPHDHEIVRRLRIIHAVGVSLPDHPKLELYLKAHEKAEAAYFLKTQGIKEGDKLIGLHPGSKDAFKRWPIEYFEQLGEKFLGQKGVKIVITGSSDEAKLVKQLMRKLPDSVGLFGQVSLRVMMAIIEKMAIYVTNDTGPMHIAFTFETPTIALFSPTHPNLCGPLHAKNALVQFKERCCHPCLHKKCRDPFCMRQISQTEVIHQALTLLDKGNN